MKTTDHKPVAASIAAVILPLAIGLAHAQTQAPPPAYTYDVASIHRSSPDEHNTRIGGGPQGGMRLQNVTAMFMLSFAYGIADYQVVGAPRWMSTDHFDVTFTPDKTETALVPGVAGVKELESVMGRQKQRTQAILRDRFGLILHLETRELPMYALTLAKGGHKLSRPVVLNRGVSLQGGRAQLVADGPGATMKMLADQLSANLGQPVSDETGLDGLYIFGSAQECGRLS